MNGNEFVTMDMIFENPATIALFVIMLTQVSKGLFDRMTPNKTKWVVLLFSVILCIVGAITYGDLTSPEAIGTTMLVWLLNTAIVWMGAMKAFEVFAEGEPTVVKINSNDADAMEDGVKIAASMLPEVKNIRVKLE